MIYAIAGSYTLTQLAPSRKGANARGICANKRTKRARHQKRQYVPGNAPTLRNSTPRFDHA